MFPHTGSFPGPKNRRVLTTEEVLRLLSDQVGELSQQQPLWLLHTVAAVLVYGCACSAAHESPFVACFVQPPAAACAYRRQRLPPLPESHATRAQVSEQRLARLRAVAAARCYSVVPIVEGLHDVGNMSAVCRSADGARFLRCIV